MKKVLVIGASGLLGSHLVKALHGKADVVEASLHGTQHSVDLADPASLKNLFKKVGQVDAIACTAGMVRFVPWANASDEDWAHGLANKVMGQVNVVRFGAGIVREGGAITLTTGVLSQYPMAGSAIVTTTNSAVEGFVRACGVELGSKVRVNAVSPGWVTETLQAMGMDSSSGLPAARVAEFFVKQLLEGAAGSVVIAAKQG